MSYFLFFHGQIRTMITLLTSTNDSMIVRFHDVAPALLNSFRRIMLSDIETYCIDTIIFEKNNTCYPDEFLAHRLGLVPFQVDSATDEPISMKLHKRNNTDKIMTVYSSDFEQKASCRPVSFDKFKKGISICKLSPGQSISFVANLFRGSGREHAKWCPVSTAVFRKVNDTAYDFHVESTGVYTPHQLFEKTFSIWRQKILQL